jgi:hypothetical protein
MITAIARRLAATSTVTVIRMASCFRMLNPPGRQRAVHPKGYGTAPIERIDRRSQVHRPTVGVRDRRRQYP